MKNVKDCLKFRNGGITLIALVITIIVLLILAGVSIATLTGDNGILTQANNAKEKTKEAEDIEKIRLAISEAQIGENGYQVLDQNNLQEAIDNQFIGRNAIVSDNGEETFTVSLENKIYKIKNNEVSEIQVDLYINNEEDLKNFRDDVNAGNTYEGKYIILTSNITLDINEEWEPIGVYPNENSSPDDETNNPFKGTFDGCGHEINGIYINTTDKVQGLFGLINMGTIKNVGIGEENNINGGESTGSVVGYAYNNSKVINCFNETNLNYAGNNSGGIIGILNNSTIENSYNLGNITSTGISGTGGVVGMSTSNATVENCYNDGIIIGNTMLGGIVGFNQQNSTIIKCYNKNNIISNSLEIETNVGGIVGNNQRQSIVQECFNRGNVQGNDGLGGITGRIVSNSKIINCYNIGQIIANNKAGGISGIIGAYNTTSTETIENCYNAGEIVCTNNVGAIYGYVYNTATIDDRNNYYLENTVNNMSDSISNATSKNSEELKNLYTTLGNAFEKDTNNINNGYPILSWQ